MSDAQTLKAEGMAYALDANANWREFAYGMIKELPADWQGTGEDIREWIGEEPRHPNAWGALINSAISKSLIYATGAHVAMNRPKSHGRQTAVYRRAASA
jgi:hypothetical protein